MATYTLIPSSLTGGSSISNASRAYTNTSSTTYATVKMGSSVDAWLGGFDFSVVPAETILSVAIKLKAKSTNACNARVYSYSDSDSVALSNSANVGNLSSEWLITFTLSSNLDVICSYLAAGTLAIRIWTSISTVSPQIYGAEVIVETDATPKANKIIYGGNTILDLTEDTVTRAKVLSGTTFHLPSGVQATGMLSSLPVATATTTGSTTRTLSFTDLTKQPSWFMMICSSTNTTARNNRVQHMLYDGTTTTTYYTNSSTAGSIATSTSYGSFTYSSGTLTITVDTTPYLGKADWELHYL